MNLDSESRHLDECMNELKLARQRLALADRLAASAQALYSDMDWGDTYPQISTPEDADKLGQNLGLALHDWFK